MSYLDRFNPEYWTGWPDSPCTDEQMDAEVLIMGAMMASPEKMVRYAGMISPITFFDPFHAAVSQIAQALHVLDMPTLPVDVWSFASRHPRAEYYGLEHLEEAYCRAERVRSVPHYDVPNAIGLMAQASAQRALWRFGPEGRNGDGTS